MLIPFCTMKHGCGLGIRLPFLGCCSKDDGHHFKRGVIIIIGIKWESTSWVETFGTNIEPD